MSQHVLTIDVEDWYHVENLRSSFPPERWVEAPSRLEANVDRLLELFDRHGVKTTCFVLGRAAERCPTAIRRIVEQGHEVASHGWSHDLIYRQTPELFREETHRSRVFLEDLAGRPVLGYRASTFSITSASLWALEILADEGFAYDSSIAPLRHDRYGIPEAFRAPFRMELPGGRELAEFPVCSGRVAGLDLPLGGGFFRLFPLGWTRRALARLQADGRTGMIYLHPWEIDPDQPRVPGLKALARFRHYVGLGRTYAKLERLLAGHQWCTMAEFFEREGGDLPCRHPLGGGTREAS